MSSRRSIRRKTKNRIEVESAGINCEICNDNHLIEDCPIINSGIRVKDAELPKKAFLTLPEGFKTLEQSDGTFDVFSTQKLSKGTQFGPFFAPKASQHNPLCSYVLRIFKGSESICFLDTTDKDKCNWMSLVRFTTDSSKNNCICYQLKNQIYFSVITKIQPNHCLIVGYSPGYLAQLQNCKIQTKQELTLSLHSLENNYSYIEETEIKSEKDFPNEPYSDLENNFSQNNNNYCDHDYVVPSINNAIDSCRRLSRRKRKISDKLDLDNENNSSTDLDESSDFEVTKSYQKRRLCAVYARDNWRCKFCHEQLESLVSFANHLIEHYKTVGAARTEKDRMNRFKSSVPENMPDYLNCSVKIQRLTEGKNTQNKIENNSSGDLKTEDIEQDTKIKTDPCYPYTCDICVKQKIFNRAEYIIRHLKTHSEVDLFCVTCCKKFATKTEEKNHECPHVETTLPSSDENLKSSIYRCKLCKRLIPISKNGEQRNHVCNSTTKIDNTDDEISLVLNCEACEQEFSKPADFEKHLKQYHTKSDFLCTVCGKALSNETLKAHTAICQVLQKFVDCSNKDLICPMFKCGKNFKNLQDFKDHVAMHTHPFMCPSCNKRMKTATEMRVHLCEKITCDGCDKSFASLNSLKDHIGQVHKVSASYCFECTTPFVTVEGYMKHGDCELQRVIQSDKSQTCQDEVNSIFICEICGATYNKWSSLKTHRYTHGPKKYSCKTCGKSFHRKELLTDHCFVHGEAMFSCERCDKKFKSRKSLQVHLRIHLNIKPYLCSTCGRPFTQKVNLRSHELTHVNEKSFKCSYKDCKKKFSTKEYLKFHMEAHENGKHFVCQVCDKRFVRQHFLNQHKRISHGNHRYKCEFCVPELYVRQKHSLFRHLAQRHSKFLSVWSQEGYGDKMYIPGDGNYTHPGAKSRRKIEHVDNNNSSAEEDEHEKQNEEIALIISRSKEDESERLEFQGDEIEIGDTIELEAQENSTSMVLLQLDNSGRYVIAFPHELQKSQKMEQTIVLEEIQEIEAFE